MRRATKKARSVTPETSASLFGAFCPDEDDIEARCMLFYSLWIGSHFMPQVWRKELDQLKANQLYTDTAEALKLKYLDVKP